MRTESGAVWCAVVVRMLRVRVERVRQMRRRRRGVSDAWVDGGGGVWGEEEVWEGGGGEEVQNWEEGVDEADFFVGD